MVTKHRADLPVLCGCFPLAIYFTFGLTSSQLTLSSPRVLKSILCICVFIPVLPLGSSEPYFFFFFFRFHIYVLAYDICFSLSDLLHSVWQTLGPSTSLQITQFHFFLWLSNILHCSKFWQLWINVYSIKILNVYTMNICVQVFVWTSVFNCFG